MQRAVTASISIESGQDALQRGFYNARRLWNELWWCTFGYNERLRWRRGDSWEQYKRRRPTRTWPGKFAVQKIMADFGPYRDLSDRCSSYTIADFDIAMKSWWSNLKRNPDARPPRAVKEDRTLTFEVGRNAKPLGDWRYRLTVLGGAIAERHVVVRVHVRPGVKMANVHLIRVTPTLKRGRYQVSLITTKPAAARAGDGVAALDLGIVNLGALAFEHDDILYVGRHLLDVQRLANKRAAACKPAGYTGTEARLPASRRSKTYKAKATNTRALAVHVFTTDVIRQCVARGVGVLAVGALTGIRTDKDFGSAGNQKFHAWTQGRIREQLRWKGEEHGVEVIEISEAYTSQTCSGCGCVRKSNRVERGLYVCAECGLAINADVNGARNMLRRATGIAKSEKIGVGGDLSTPPSLRPEREQAQEPAKRTANRQLSVMHFDLRSMTLKEAGHAERSAVCNAT
ncbi:MAG: transposase [Vampirovibrionales bacterium]|nr:transposase [Vampirovibrionales bacterium]